MQTMKQSTTPAMLVAASLGLNIDASPGGIQRSERAGQEALVASTDMPKEMRPCREAFEKDPAGGMETRRHRSRHAL
jgi:hypothetical protein